MTQAAPVRLLVPMLACLMGASCAGAPTVSLAPSTSPSPGPLPSASQAPSPSPLPARAPTPTPSPTAGQGGPPGAGCVNGWLAAQPGSPEHEQGVEMLALEMGLPDDLAVVEMRYFIGPDAPWIIEPHYPAVERWYIKAQLASQPEFAGRWLLERRTVEIHGISAVAPFGSTGYQSPDWRAFFGDGAPRAIEGLPGLWAGLEYDFVSGEGDHGMPGLPDDVVDCLAGT